MKKILLLSLLAAGFANLTFAQVTVFASASVTILRPLAVVKNGDLDFGTIVANPFNYAGLGTLYLDPLQQVAPIYTNGLVPVGNGTPHGAQFLIYGTPNASISISSSTPTGQEGVYLVTTNPNSAGYPILVSLVFMLGNAQQQLNQPLTAMLDASGNQQLNIGGTLYVQQGVPGGLQGFFTLQNAVTFIINYN